jgi:trimeric autotransporter adhesin
MSGYRQGLLNSASATTLAFAAELTAGLQPHKSEKKRSKFSDKKPSTCRSLVNVAGAGAFAVAVVAGLTTFPQEVFAAGPAVCLQNTGTAAAAGTNAFACGTGALVNGANSTALGDYAQAKYGPNNTATGTYSFAGGRTDGLFNGNGYGRNNTATGENSFAGAFTGKYGYARGSANTATGQNSFAGAQTGAGYKYTGGTAIAYGNTANGHNSFAGAYTFAHGQYGGDPFTAVAKAYGNTAIGNGAYAGQVGLYYAYAKGNTAVGYYAFAGNDLGGKAIGNTALGTGSVADGQFNSALGTYSQAIGFGNSAAGTGAYAYGIENSASGTNAYAKGLANSASGTESFAYGLANSASGSGATAIGAFNTATGTSAYAYGTAATATGAYSSATGYAATATGAGSSASGAYSTAMGANTQANADGSVAIGTDSTGQGAVANLPDEFVLGTKKQTYTAPGITSGLSQSRQSGPLEVVTSDANGHLATDNGAVFHQVNHLGNEVDRARSGIALAIAMAGPDLTGNERFGVSANWGNFDGENGFGMGFEGVLWNNFLTTGGRFAVTGGFGVGFTDNGNNNTFGHSFGSSDDNVWGGRVGGQWTWGHRATAYAVPPESTPLK